MPKTERPVSQKILQINQAISKSIDTAADKLDQSLIPSLKDLTTQNKTYAYIISGVDYSKIEKGKKNLRYGIKLHLPRFEQYWKLRFESKDRRQDRGINPLSSQKRAQSQNNDIFVGVGFSENWKRFKIDYEPKIVFKHGLGLNHSIEGHTEFLHKQFSTEFSLEFFTSHNEGAGSSSVLNFQYWLTPFQNLALKQSNDTRYLFLYSNLVVTHALSLLYIHSDRLSMEAGYFRSFVNTPHYVLDAYGTGLTSRYVLYKDFFTLELTPYTIKERLYQFKQNYGATLNLHTTL